MESIIESRFRKTLIRCPVCDKPIGQRLGDQWWFEKYNKGESGKIHIAQNQKTPYGSYRVRCWDKNCKGGHIFAWVNERLCISDVANSESE